MSTSLFVIIGVVSIAAFAFARLTMPPQQPPVIYVQVAEPEPRGGSFLPLMVIGIIIYVILRLLVGS